jgi:hypothetical protein
MKWLLPLILALGLTGCIDIPIPYFDNKKNDEPTAKEKIQENRSEAQIAQQEYEDLQDTRTSQ